MNIVLGMLVSVILGAVWGYVCHKIFPMPYALIVGMVGGCVIGAFCIEAVA